VSSRWRNRGRIRFENRRAGEGNLSAAERSGWRSIKWWEIITAVLRSRRMKRRRSWSSRTWILTSQRRISRYVVIIGWIGGGEGGAGRQRRLCARRRRLALFRRFFRRSRRKRIKALFENRFPRIETTSFEEKRKNEYEHFVCGPLFFCWGGAKLSVFCLQSAQTPPKDFYIFKKTIRGYMQREREIRANV